MSSISISGKLLRSATTASTEKLGVVLQGYLKKLKTMKKRYFVLFKDSEEKPARLEYYDSEKKFKSKNAQAKRTIILKNCIYINRRLESKNKFVISLYSKEECFSIVYETENELNKWLNEFKALHHYESAGEPTRVNIDHVWQVQVQRRGLAEEKGLIGLYILCLTDKSLSLDRSGPPSTLTGEKRLRHVEFLLTTIRRCGDSQCYFYMEIGRASALGAGELWMDVGDALIAKNMHSTIIQASTACNKYRDELPPIQRIRSASHGGKTFTCSPSNETQMKESRSDSGGSTFGSACTVISAISASQSPNSTTTVNDCIVTEPSSIVNLITTNNSPVAGTYCQIDSTTNIQGDSTSKSVNNNMPSVCHQRALSLPITTPMLNVTTSNNGTSLLFNNANFISSSRQQYQPDQTSIKRSSLSQPNNNNLLTKSSNSSSTSCVLFANTQNNDSNNHNSLQPDHQRTRSLPLAEPMANNFCNLNNHCVIAIHHNRSCSLLNCNGNSNFNSIDNDRSINNNYHHNNNYTVYQCIRNNSNIIENVVNSNSNTNSNQLSNGGLVYHNKYRNCTESNGDAFIPYANDQYNNRLNVCKCNYNSSMVTPQYISMDSIVEDQPITTLNRSSYTTTGNYLMTDDFQSSHTYVNVCSTTQLPVNHNTIVPRDGAIPSVQNYSVPLIMGQNEHSGSVLRDSSAMIRERCDSLPTTNRGISDGSNIVKGSMPPPRAIPCNRPKSVYHFMSNMSSNTSTDALSPSVGCSESDGSSLSIDEPDGLSHHSLTPDESGVFLKFINSRATGCVIPEEVDYNVVEHNIKNNSTNMKMNNGKLTLPLSQFNIGSTQPMDTVDGHPNFSDMYSPCSSSPGDPHTNQYMIMTPSAEIPRSLYTGSSGAHSRASSFTEEGYVPHEPATEEYVNVDSAGQHHHHQAMSGMSSAGSSCSITSGTPTTDIRFAEYHLDKVYSPFIDEEESMSIRQTRANSVGSRLDHNKRKLRPDLLTADSSNARMRAFSVGSRAKVPRSEVYRGCSNTTSTLINHYLQKLSSPQEDVNVNITNNNEKKGDMSSSAPILIGKGSVQPDPMADLMEIDYSRKDDKSDSHQGTPTRVHFSGSAPNDRQSSGGFISMSPRNTSTHPTKQTSEGYVEMKPLQHEFPVSKAYENGYMEMKPVGGSDSNLSTSPIKSYSLTKNIPMGQRHNKNYVAMAPIESSGGVAQKVVLRHNSTESIVTKPVNQDYLNMSPIINERPIGQESYLNMFKEQQDQNGQYPMTNNNHSTENQSDYMNIDYQRSDKLNQRLTSQPITIVSNKTQPIHHHSYLLAAGGPQKSQQTGTIQLIGTSRPRCNSKDSGISTPSGSHSSIFPFSPGSPVQHPFTSQISIEENNLPRKCLVDGTTGTIRISEEDSTQPDISTPDVPDPAKILNTDVVMDEMMDESIGSTATTQQLEVLSNNYADMTLSEYKRMNSIPKLMKLKSEPSAEYVNFNPATDGNITASGDDYAIMNPSQNQSSTEWLDNPLTTKKSLLIVSHGSNPLLNRTGFKPIASADDIMRNSSKKNRKEKGLSINADSTGDQSVKRPNSVNSDKTLCTLVGGVPNKNPFGTISLNSRPSSVNSDRLSSFSTSSSSHTLCDDSSSSSSTLCGSKTHSPCSNTPRPHSYITNERSESVQSITDPNSIISRPPSVSSDRELHYASLDLPPATKNIIQTSTANINSAITENNDSAYTLFNPTLTLTTTSTTVSTTTKSSGIDSSSSSPSPNAYSTRTEPPTFSYAQIDFVKSEHNRNIKPL